eukprot:gnl/TRDRNA2_/TRDRNA2_142255_c0_seq1.p1 gnl/TRDRNA2_/TRDRNA2_142255_c0~~gnl/TRDRNA2_/TRDRNA2_142255_c0_seq1.p1  ORF type:complete len:153 (+),score=11.35 gnl/TRDRNA2_/TRDRNA2_142255_c0_seq1:80-538(+)
MDAFSPVFELQTLYDEILARPERFPANVQRIHSLAQAERRRRQPIVDQSPLGQGRNALLSARKVIYVILSRNDTRTQLCATRFSCAQDFLERSARAHGKKRGPGRWLASQGLENLWLYTLESLHGDGIFYHKAVGPRLHFWARALEDPSRGL